MVDDFNQTLQRELRRERTGRRRVHSTLSTECPENIVTDRDVDLVISKMEEKVEKLKELQRMTNSIESWAQSEYSPSSPTMFNEPEDWANDDDHEHSKDEGEEDENEEEETKQPMESPPKKARIVRFISYNEAWYMSFANFICLYVSCIVFLCCYSICLNIYK